MDIFKLVEKMEAGEEDIIEDTVVLEGVKSQRRQVEMGGNSRLEWLSLQIYFFCGLPFFFLE